MALLHFQSIIALPKVVDIDYQLKKLIEQWHKGYITTWRDIYIYLPESVLARKIGIHPTKMKKIAKLGDNARISDVKALANLLQDNHHTVYAFVERSSGTGN